MKPPTHLRLVSSTSSPEPPSVVPEEKTAKAPMVVVDPGQVIRVHARFPDKPAAVRFSFLAPGAKIAFHDPGTDHEGTQIEQEFGGNLYSFTIDTRKMFGGKDKPGWWYFFSDDPDPRKRRAKVGRFYVRDVPRALLERPEGGQEPEHEDSGFDLFGLAEEPRVHRALTEDEKTARKVLIGIGIGAVTLGIGAGIALGVAGGVAVGASFGAGVGLGDAATAALVK